MTISAKRKIALVKIETTYGTDPVPTGTADTLLAINLQVSEPLSIKFVDRKVIRAFFGSFTQLPGTAYVKLDFEVELAGFGTAGGTQPIAAVDALWRSCAMSRTINTGISTVYAPVSTAIESVTCYYYQDGTLHKATGCVGDWEISLKVGEIPSIKYTLWGKYSPVVDQVLPTAVITAYQQPLVVDSDNTGALNLFGWNAACLESLSIKAGNALEQRNLVNCTSRILLTDRNVTGSLTVDAPKIAEFDAYTAIKNAQTGAFTITHGLGAPAGQQVVISSNVLQLVSPKFSESQNIVQLQTDLRFPPSPAGNDDITVTYK